MGTVLGTGLSRIEGAAKVTGTAVYASDPPRVGVEGRPAHAALVTSTVARGRITGFDLTAAQRVPGLIAVFTHRDFAGAVAPVTHLMAGGYVNSGHRPLDSDAVAYAGQIVALVVAETSQAAAAAAAAVTVAYEEAQASAGFDSPGADTVLLADLKAHHEDIRTGDARAALAASPTGSRPATRPPRSTITRSSCSPPVAPGTAIALRSMSRPAMSAPCSTGSRRSSAWTRRRSGWSRR